MPEANQLRSYEPAAQELLARVCRPRRQRRRRAPCSVIVWLLAKVCRGRQDRPRRRIIYALPGSEEARYLKKMGANANVGGPTLTHIILWPDARKVEVLEEFLHGTQFRIGLFGRMSTIEVEIHVKRFMLRHATLLGIRPDDQRVLQEMLGRYL